MNKIGLSIIIPVYNEVAGIKSTIEAMKKLLECKDFPMEVIFVDDGSMDGTSEKLDKFLSVGDNYKLIRHKKNRGYGAALKTGIKSSVFDYICITDADETYPNERIPEFLSKTKKEDLDMLVGARVGKGVKIPLIRKPPKWVLNKLANYLADYSIPDLNSGLRIMKRKSVQDFIHILPNGFSFTTTITLAMLTNDYRVEYEKINYFHRAGSSKIRPIYDTLNFTQLIIRTILLFKPLKVFLPVSGFMFLTALGLVLYRIFFNQAFGVTATVIFVGSIQLLAIGMLADLINRRLQK